MKKYKYTVRWSVMEPKHYEVDLYAEGANQAAHIILTSPIWASNEKTILSVEPVNGGKDEGC